MGLPGCIFLKSKSGAGVRQCPILKGTMNLFVIVLSLVSVTAEPRYPPPTDVAMKMAATAPTLMKDVTNRTSSKDTSPKVKENNAVLNGTLNIVKSQEGQKDNPSYVTSKRTTVEPLVLKPLQGPIVETSNETARKDVTFQKSALVVQRNKTDAVITKPNKTNVTASKSTVKSLTTPPTNVTKPSSSFKKIVKNSSSTRANASFVPHVTPTTKAVVPTRSKTVNLTSSVPKHKNKTVSTTSPVRPMNKSVVPSQRTMNRSTVALSTSKVAVINITSAVPLIINVSSTAVVKNLTVILLNSTVIQLSSSPSFIVMNSTTGPTPMNSTSSIMINSSLPFSSFVCPTTTIYINCSTDMFTLSPSSHFSSVDIASSNISSVDMTSVVASTRMSSINMISPSYVYNSTTLPNMTSTHIMNSSSIHIKTSISSSHMASSSASFPLSSFSPSPSTSTIPSSSLTPHPPIISKCDRYLDEFITAHVDLSKCMLRWMHPMRVCSNCSAQYAHFKGFHKKIFIECGVTLIYDYNSKYQVIPKIYSAQEATWKSLECEKCYVQSADGTYHYSKDFAEYIGLYLKLNKCFDNHTQVTLINTLNGTVAEKTYNRSICTDCLHIYKTMQGRYEYYGDDGESTRWCADINVAVNETRHRWSNDFHCGHKAKDLESVIALTAFFCFLPIVFYVGAKLHADVRERKSANRGYHYDSDEIR